MSRADPSIRSVVRRRLLLGAAAFAASSCASKVAVAPSATWRSPLAANPRLGVWPEAVRGAPTEVREAYAFAVQSQETLQWIPCYCGCGAQGHRDNFDCYVKERHPDGWLTLDTHGLG